MWTIDLVDRVDGKVVVSEYASGFESYTEARQWADRNEIGFRAIGWTSIVRQMS